MQTIRTILADDHELVAEGIKSLLDGVPHIEVLAEARNGKELLRYADVLLPDVALVDLNMPVMDGFETIKILKKEYPSIKTIAITMFAEKAVSERVMQLGASGYVLKNSPVEDLVEAIEKVNCGGTYCSEIKTGKRSSLVKEQLTKREIEIIALIAEGNTNREIAEALNISHRTVDTHRTNIMRKLNIHNSAALVRTALKEGIITRD
ncbi:MAG: response regulator transcription factor [Salibacter sp.]|jgi:DNA-binding NarL/FixJ family response regulator|uniref:response regulator transcription factor n=1 Tax=Salibacter sp. TaxID=2010995 RepID=UPI0028702E5C|nr:response regulator transcription factor [Salibacter sp.]MDR9399425.1 response regulator transcription factor [Salibacter sp.]